MKVIPVRNVHEALPTALRLLRAEGVERSSRNGPVTKFPCPVTTVYARPTERVLFWPQRDANPFFHLHEALWMLGGRNDVDSVAAFVARMREYSDDGKSFHGAYGYRWRIHFGMDQLAAIIALLKQNPDDRRCVLQMWDASIDLARAGKDFPCNTQAVFQINDEGQLDMTVFNRSNDIIWGAYGANAVHFSYLQEYVASSIQREVGRYWQVSTNFHAYLDTLEKLDGLADRAGAVDDAHSFETRQPYHSEPFGENVEPFPMMSVPQAVWDGDLYAYLNFDAPLGISDPFFRRVAIPMRRAYEQYKRGRGRDRILHALDEMEQVRASDWKRAGTEWLRRRLAKFDRANDGGVTHADD